MIAMPKLTSGFSTAAESDIRTGAGNNQVEYNMNAPVSIDGGGGFNKVVILGTEYADHIVVTALAVYGAGLWVTYTNIQVLEIDALEGDDTIDVLSTAPGVETRVIGGLGSDIVNVGSDVVGDVFARDIEGTSGTVNHLVTSNDPNYNGLVVNGVDLSVARPGAGPGDRQGERRLQRDLRGRDCFTLTPVGCVLAARLVHRRARRGADGQRLRLRLGRGLAAGGVDRRHLPRVHDRRQPGRLLPHHHAQRRADDRPAARDRARLHAGELERSADRVHVRRRRRRSPRATAP